MRLVTLPSVYAASPWLHYFMPNDNIHNRASNPTGKHILEPS